jgi:uncharacterized membrane protein
VTPRRHAIIGAAVALAGVAVAAYLTAVKLAGELPACGPVRGCETVALSEYSDVAGVPVALLGAAFSLVLLGLNVVWWRRWDRRALIGAYGLGLMGILFIGYLTYLELFVIGAVCVWCVGYAITVVGGWLVAALGLRRY